MEQRTKGLIAGIIAGMATLLGAIPVLFIKGISPRPVAASLAFSGAIMIYVSFLELLDESKIEMIEYFAEHDTAKHWDSDKREAFAIMVSAAGMLAGYLISSFIDLVVHFVVNKTSTVKQVSSDVLAKNFQMYEDRRHNKHNKRFGRCMWGFCSSINCSSSPFGEDSSPDEWAAFNETCATYMKAGVTTAIALGLHNLPEGLASYCSFLGTSDSLGYGLVAALTVHNIPEGFSVALPIFLASGKPWLAFVSSCLSGFAETFAAVISYFVITEDHISPCFLAIIYAIIAGVMINVATNELLLIAFKFNKRGNIINSAYLWGTVIIAFSLVLFNIVTPLAPIMVEEFPVGWNPQDLMDASSEPIRRTSKLMAARRALNDLR